MLNEVVEKPLPSVPTTSLDYVFFTRHELTFAYRHSSGGKPASAVDKINEFPQFLSVRNRIVTHQNAPGPNEGNDLASNLNVARAVGVKKNQIKQTASLPEIIDGAHLYHSDLMIEIGTFEVAFGLTNLERRHFQSGHMSILW